MSVSRLSTAPPELICRVFELLDNFSEVAALAKTGRVFYQTWRKHAMSISRAVASHSFPNFIEAERLLDIQEKANCVDQPLDSGEQKSIVRAKRLLSNARCAAAVCADWVDFCQIQDSGIAYCRGPEGSAETYMRPSERARFDRTFYSLWTIAVMQSAPHLQSHASAYLENCTSRELIRLDEMATWASSYNENNFGAIGLDMHDDVWEAGYNIVSRYYMAYLKKGTPTPGPCPTDTPMGFFAFFDHTQRYLEEYHDR